ncbi:MAG: oxidoreductase [Nitrospirae bacterium RIFCSPLOW2_12_42_9]|nr:MAG: oxidoreductase [Nitrospirae bacterium RIFCSPLOW2_12_42_9]
MKEDIKIAVIGSGYWGKNLVRNFYELQVLQTVCDTDTNRLKQMMKDYPGINTTTSFNEVLKDEDIKALAIATPASTHYELVKAALQKGKDVFVEKPLALTVKEGDELVKIARKLERVLMVGHILQYHPAAIKLKEMIDHGELGKIQYIYSNRLNIGKLRTEENILWSFAPHDISLILMLLGESPTKVTAFGGDYLQRDLYDTTLTTLDFPSKVKAHIFVSWLHPFKEQKLVVVGGKKMAVFDDMTKEKLFLYPHKVEWVNRVPVAQKAEIEPVQVDTAEPLKEECRHFIECVTSRKNSKTDGEEGLRVLKVLEEAENTLLGSKVSNYPLPSRERDRVRGTEDLYPKYTAHETAIIDDPCEIGENTKIWHFSHILKGSRIGKNCIIGQNVVIGPDVTIGDKCKVQNNVSLYKGVVLEDEVFCGPSCVFTNVYNPRAFIERKHEFLPTLVKRGATIGANSTIVCGTTIGRYAVIGAGAVVKTDVPDYAIVAGVPAKQKGWACKCGVTLRFNEGGSTCGYCGNEYGLEGGNLIIKKEEN